jgi:hypothetical protein
VGEERLYRDLDIPFLNDLGSIEDLDLKRLPSRGEMDMVFLPAVGDEAAPMTS